MVMLRKLVSCLFYLFIVRNFPDANAFTHWVVTEDGRIQHQMESPFAMVQPDNLAAFLNQERAQEKLKEMHKNLILRHEEIEANEDKETDLESRHYENDQDCIRADKGIKVSDHIDLDENLPFNEPNCSEFFNLPFSVHAYDHLLAVQQRNTLERQPLKRLKNKMDFLKNPRVAASAIHQALEKNSTSWVLYNLASFYWRLEGNTSAAIECIRRALHFSPEKTKDVALVNLANVLHQADYTKNATVVLLHALDISGGKDFVNYYHLGNMFASMGNFNRSIYYYEKSLRFKKSFEPAVTRLAAVKCELKLQGKLEAQHDSLQRTLHELQEHRVMHEKYQEKQEQLAKQHHGVDEQFQANLLFHQQKIREGYYGNACILKTNDDNSPVLMCELSAGQEQQDIERMIPIHHQPNCDEKYGRKVLPASPAEKVYKKIREIRKSHDELLIQYREYQKKLQEMRLKSVDDDDEDEENNELLKPKPKVYHSYYDYTHPDWPPKESCKEHVKRYPQWDEFPSGYIDPQSRDFPVRRLLTSYIGVAPGEQHASPWKKPECGEIESNPATPYDIVAGISNDINSTMWKQDTYLNNYFLKHVNEGTVWPDDIGQRILSALKKAHMKRDYDHVWVLYNLAGLFWRVNGDNKKAIECLRRSIYHAPKLHRDIPLVSLANIMYRNGRTSDSLNLLIYALQVNNSEPVTYLSMGNVLQENMNLTGAIQFYNYALVLYPDYKEALQSLLIVKCFKITGKRVDGERPNNDDQVSLDDIREAVAMERKEKEVENTEEEKTTSGGREKEDEEEVENDDNDGKEEQAEEKEEKREEDEVTNDLNVKEQTKKENKKKKEEQECGRSCVNLNVSRKEMFENMLISTQVTSADVLIQKAEELISKLVDDEYQEQIVEKIDSAQKMMKSLNNLQTTLSNLVDEATILSSSQMNDHCANITKINFTNLEHQNLTEAFLYETNFSLDVAIDDSIDVKEPICQVDKDMMNFIFDFKHVKTNCSKPEPRLDMVAKELIDETESPNSLANYLASASLSHPHNWRVALLSALYWRTIGNVRETFACFQLAMSQVQRCCRDVIIYVVIDYMTHIGRINDAISLCEKLMQRHPYSAAVQYLMGNLYASQGRYVRALSTYKNIVKYQNNEEGDYRDCLLRIQNIKCLLMKEEDNDEGRDEK